MTNSLPLPSNTVFRSEVIDWMYSVVNAETGVARREIEPKIRENRVVRARLAMYLAMRRRGWTTPVIGSVMTRDHTTVVSGIRTARKYYDRDPQFRALVDRLAG